MVTTAMHISPQEIVPNSGIIITPFQLCLELSSDAKLTAYEELGSSPGQIMHDTMTLERSSGGHSTHQSLSKIGVR